MKSTSFHKLSNDNKNLLNQFLVRLLYYPFNILNNSLKNQAIDKNIQYKNLNINQITEKLEKVDPSASPSRKLCDLFWMQLPWLEFEKKIGKMNALDIGCGTGIYYEKIQSWSNSNIHTYRGIDIYEKPEWHKYNPTTSVNFDVYSGLDATPFLSPDTNFIFSQSAIEHFTEDLTIFKQIQSFIEKNKKPIIQIHLFPASRALWLYRYHGIRQYTLRNISKITKLFNQYSDIELYCLGGKECAEIHKKYITRYSKFSGIRQYLFKQKITLRTETHTEEYINECNKAIIKDLYSTKNKNPHFYALVIKSYC